MTSKYKILINVPVIKSVKHNKHVWCKNIFSYMYANQVIQGRNNIKVGRSL